MIYNYFKGIVVLFSLLLIQGCDMSKSAVNSQLNFNNFSGNGLVVGSISFPTINPTANGYNTTIKSLDLNEKIAKKNTTWISIRPAQLVRGRHKGELEGGKTYLYAIERIPGKYNLSRISFTYMGFGGYVATASASGFSVPFDVKAGQITYVGDLFIDEYASKNDTMIFLKDNFDRDIEGLRKLKPAFDWGNAKKSPVEIIYN